MVSLSNGRINQNLIFKVIHSGNCDQNWHKNVSICEYKQEVIGDCNCTLVQATIRKHYMVLKMYMNIHKPFEKKTTNPIRCPISGHPEGNGQKLRDSMDISDKLSPTGICIRTSVIQYLHYWHRWRDRVHPHQISQWQQAEWCGWRSWRTGCLPEVPGQEDCSLFFQTSGYFNQGINKNFLKNLHQTASRILTEKWKPLPNKPDTWGKKHVFKQTQNHIISSFYTSSTLLKFTVWSSFSAGAGLTPVRKTVFLHHL